MNNWERESRRLYIDRLQTYINRGRIMLHSLSTINSEDELDLADIASLKEEILRDETEKAALQIAEINDHLEEVKRQLL